MTFADKAQLLKNHRASALGFPDWFGHNWDALEDCLTDLSWREAPAHVLLIEDPKPGDDLGVLIDILRSSAESWAATRQAVLRGVRRSRSARCRCRTLFRQS